MPPASPPELLSGSNDHPHSHLPGPQLDVGWHGLEHVQQHEEVVQPGGRRPSVHCFLPPRARITRAATPEGRPTPIMKTCRAPNSQIAPSSMHVPPSRAPTRARSRAPWSARSTSVTSDHLSRGAAEAPGRSSRRGRRAGSPRHFIEGEARDDAGEELRHESSRQVDPRRVKSVLFLQLAAETGCDGHTNSSSSPQLTSTHNAQRTHPPLRGEAPTRRRLARVGSDAGGRHRGGAAGGGKVRV